MREWRKRNYKTRRKITRADVQKISRKPPRIIAEELEDKLP
jgi:hypothetical protein